MFKLTSIGNNTFMIVKDNEVDSQSYGFIRITKLEKSYGISLKDISDEVYASGMLEKLEQQAKKLVETSY